jgi:hypothetical protein
MISSNDKLGTAQHAALIDREDTWRIRCNDLQQSAGGASTCGSYTACRTVQGHGQQRVRGRRSAREKARRRNVRHCARQSAAEKRLAIIASKSSTAATIDSTLCSAKNNPVGSRVREIADRFERAALAVGNDRRTARLCFDHRNAEVFFSGEDEGFRATASGHATPRTVDSP